MSASFDWRRERIEWPVTTDVGPGMAGVIATETQVMWLDPTSGRLDYRGVQIEALAHLKDFEQVTYLLINGRMPEEDPSDFESFCSHLRASRNLPSDVIHLLRGLDPSTHPTRMLRAAVSALGCHELSTEDDLAGERLWKEVHVVGQVAALVGEICRHRKGLESKKLEPEQSLAEGLLHALNNRPPLPEETQALNLLWVLYAAHGLDAPTFTSMVVASCLADPYYNIVAGISALRGTKTGGASEQVLSQQLPLRTNTEAQTWVKRTLDSGGVIAGFGHHAYHMPDPRVALLRKETAAFARSRGQGHLFEVARTVEDAATRALAPKGVYININFYGALLFHLLGAEPQFGPSLFAVGRMAGMVALVREALDTIRLYRPLSRYVGNPERHLYSVEHQ